MDGRLLGLVGIGTRPRRQVTLSAGLGASGCYNTPASPSDFCSTRTSNDGRRPEARPNYGRSETRPLPVTKTARRAEPETAILRCSRRSVNDSPSVFPPRCGSGGTGRRASLRSLWPQGRGGSSPLFRTTQNQQLSVIGLLLLWGLRLVGCGNSCGDTCGRTIWWARRLLVSSRSPAPSSDEWLTPRPCERYGRSILSCRSALARICAASWTSTPRKAAISRRVAP
jgi:hypothetical protein